MFEATLTGEDLGDVLDPVLALVDESKIHLDEDELTTTAVDPANVGMVRYRLDADGFEDYDAEGDLIGINLDRLDDVAGMASSDDAVDLDLDDDANTLGINIADSLDYTLALLDPDSIREEPDLPDIDYPAQVTLTGSDLDRAVKAADMVSDHVALSVDADEETFVVEAEGDTDDVSLELDEDDLVDIEADGDAHSLFALDYLKDMVGAIPSDAEVLVEVGEEVPTKLHFELVDGHAEITYMLAPRIETE